MLLHLLLQHANFEAPPKSMGDIYSNNNYEYSSDDFLGTVRVRTFYDICMHILPISTCSLFDVDVVIDVVVSVFVITFLQFNCCCISTCFMPINVVIDDIDDFR